MQNVDKRNIAMRTTRDGLWLLLISFSYFTFVYNKVYYGPLANKLDKGCKKNSKVKVRLQDIIGVEYDKIYYFPFRMGVGLAEINRVTGCKFEEDANRNLYGPNQKDIIVFVKNNHVVYNNIYVRDNHDLYLETGEVFMDILSGDSVSEITPTAMDMVSRWDMHNNINKGMIILNGDSIWLRHEYSNVYDFFTISVVANEIDSFSDRNYIIIK